MIEGHERHKVPKGHRRSSQWPKVRRAHIKKQPTCVVCGSTKKLEAHHIVPFHLDPANELNPINLITLCENKKDGINCHLFCGHLGSFRSFNASVAEDARQWAAKLIRRP